MKKALKWLGIGLGIILVLLVIGLTVFGGWMVKNAVNRVGPMVMGGPVTLANATFRPLSGKITLSDLHVGNPDGFKTPALFTLGEVDIDLDVRSLFKETLVIRRISVLAPHITYERGLMDSNFGTLLKRFEAADAGSSETAAASSGGRKVVIEELVITDPTLNVSVTAAGGVAVPVKLGKLELRDIGKDGGGVTMADAMTIVLRLLTSNIENAVRGAGDLVGAGAQAIGSGTRAIGDSVRDGASSIARGVGGLLGGNDDEGGDPVE